MEYVIKEWFVDETPDSDGVYVRIRGREGGIISFLLSWVGIDPTVTMTVDNKNVRFEKGSWSGFFKRITPMDKLCSSGYGYQKPWKSALVIALVGIPLITLLGLGLIIILGAIVYYFLNKQLKVEFSEIGGRTEGIAFKRSVVEGIKVDETDAARVIRILEALMQGKAPQRTLPSSAPTPASTQKSVAHTEPASETLAPAPVDNPPAAVRFCPECGSKNTGARTICASCGVSLS